jgi:hypothetical protein
VKIFPSDENEMTHIVPRNDLVEHYLSPKCWCNPEVDHDDGIVIHNALDGRDKLESGEEKLN